MSEEKSKNDRDKRTPMIEANGLSKFYGIAMACRDVSFKVCEGELVAFLGPNGAGKSTTMKLLTGYLAASEGTARIGRAEKIPAVAAAVIQKIGRRLISQRKPSLFLPGIVS